MKHYYIIARATMENFEQQFRQKGYKIVAAVDEVGRGCLAGPVTACAVVITEPSKIFVRKARGLDALLGDSKKLTFLQREKVFEFLAKIPYIQWAVAFVQPKIIDRVNIFNASKRAAREAVYKLPVKPDMVIVDGNFTLPMRIPQHAIVKADAQVLSCSIASIIAKVTRDRMMLRYHKKYPHYRFDLHKGYGTKLHYAMLRAHGPSPIHRRSFRLE